MSNHREPYTLLFWNPFDWEGVHDDDRWREYNVIGHEERPANDGTKRRYVSWTHADGTKGYALISPDEILVHERDE